MQLGATPPVDWRLRAETERLHAALNLGWSMAELRGRLRYGRLDPPGTVDYQFPREWHALPLGGEHSLTEQLIATRVAVSLLADQFDVDLPFGDGHEEPSALTRRLAETLGKALSAAERNDGSARPSDQYPDGSAAGAAWDEVADALYRWDEEIQDRLAVSVQLSTAYQLGRGLAEAFWALDPSAAAEKEHAEDAPRPCSWEFLLGPHRRDLLTAYLKRLEGVLPPLSVPAVAGPLAAWTTLVAKGDVRSYDDGAVALRSQLQLWRDVLMGARNPVSLAKRFGLRIGARQFVRVLQAYGLEITLALASIAVLAAAGYYAGANKTSSGWAVAGSILGFFGVTGAGLLARAKTQARALYVHLRQAFYADVVADKATILPQAKR